MPDTAQFILNRLSEWRINRVYGYPGDVINGLLGAFHEVGDRLEFIQTGTRRSLRLQPARTRTAMVALTAYVALAGVRMLVPRRAPDTFA